MFSTPRRRPGPPSAAQGRAAQGRAGAYSRENEERSGSSLRSDSLPRGPCKQELEVTSKNRDFRLACLLAYKQLYYSGAGVGVDLTSAVGLTTGGSGME